MKLFHRRKTKLPEPDVPIGIKVLHDPVDASVDICFVHGLTGDREKTWTAGGESEPWPKTLLPPIFPHARILTFGYDAYFVKSRSICTNGVDEHASALLDDLHGARVDARALGRPLIFVAHSLGGIVCKEAIVKSRSPVAGGDDLRDIYKSLVGIAFLGTPHRGAALAHLGSISVASLGVLINSTNKKLLDVLRFNSVLNERTHTNFSGALDERKNGEVNGTAKEIKVACFYEAHTMDFGKVVVEMKSAKLDNAYSVAIDANHRNMAKFASAEDSNFKRLEKQLKKWVNDTVLPQTPKQQPEATTMHDPLYLQCVRDLCRTTPEDDRRRIERTKGGLMEDVGDWIFDNDEFKTWKDAPQKQCLWIRGDPGKGKTMLMSGIITRLAKEQRPVSYFFCQATDGRLNNAGGVLLGLVYCLLIQKPCLISHLRSTYEIRGRQMFDDTNAWGTLATIFTEMCRDEDAQDVVFLIDALDECRTDLTWVLQLVATTHSNVRWIVSSRNELEVEESMALVDNTVPLKLELNQLTVSAAVETYIGRKVDDLSKTKSYTDEVKRTVQQYLSENAQGTFLWVALVCEVLSKRPGRRHTETDMRAFPAGLSALYVAMMANLLGHTDDAYQSLAILRTIATAFRPLSLHELAMVVSPGEADPDLPLLEESVKLCSSFVTIRDGTVYFVHQSAKDYLCDVAFDTVFPLGADHGHLELCSAALTALTKHLVRDSCHLRYPGTLTEDIEPHHTIPLAPFEYMCLFWGEHLEKWHQQSKHDPQLESTVSKFLQTKYLQWLEAMSLLGAMQVAVTSILTLKTTSRSFSGELAALVQDAYELAFESRYVIGIAPLQVYASALLFCPSENRVRRCFGAEEPDWIATKPFIPRRQDGPARLQGHTYDIGSINISSDGSYLVSASVDKILKIWDMETFICIQTIKLDRNPSHVAISTDGTLVGAVLGDNVAVWDVKTRKPFHKVNIAQSGERAQDTIFFPCLQRLTVFYDTVGMVWDLASATCIRTKQFGPFHIHSRRSSLGRQYVLITTSDDSWIRCRLDLELCDPIGAGPMKAGDISPDGRLLAVQTNDSLVIRDLTSLRETRTAAFRDTILGLVQGDRLAISRLGISDYDLRLIFKCAKTGECTTSIKLDCDDEIWITPDGRRLLCNDINALTIKDLDYTPSENQADDSGDLLCDLTLDGTRLVTASTSHMRLWDTASMAMVQHTTFDNKIGVEKVFISVDGNRVVLQVYNALLVCDPAVDDTPRCFHLPDLNSIAGYTPDLRHVVYSTGRYQTANLFNIDTGIVKLLLRHGDLRRCSTSQDGKRFACANGTDSVGIWDLSSGDLLHTFTLDSTTPGLEFFFAERVSVMKKEMTWGLEYDIIWDTTPTRHGETLDNYEELRTSSYRRGELQVRQRWNYYTCSYALEPALGQAKDGSRTSVYGLSRDGDWVTSGNKRLLYIPAEYQRFRCRLRGRDVFFVPEVGGILAFRFKPDTSRVVPRPTIDLDLEEDIFDLIYR